MKIDNRVLLVLAMPFFMYGFGIFFWWVVGGGPIDNDALAIFCLGFGILLGASVVAEMPEDVLGKTTIWGRKHDR